MRKTILISVIMALCALSYAQLSLNSDFSYLGTTLGTIGTGSYNFATNHFYACDWDDTPVADRAAILNADGTEQSPQQQLSVAGLPLGSLNVFAMGCTTDGVIYGGTNEVAPSTDQTLIRWANEAAAPTYQQFGANLLFARTIDVAGTGADTVIAITGSADDCPIQILTTTDGVTFAISETTQALTDSKAGVAINNAGNVIYCNEGYSSSPSKWIPSGTPGTWTQDVAFAPVLADTNSPIPMDYWDEKDVLFGISTRRTTSEIVVAMNGTDGSLMASAVVGQDVSIYGYGSVELKLAGTGGEGRWMARDGGGSGYACGKFTFDWPTPTPTPIVEAANSVWGLYE